MSTIKFILALLIISILAAVSGRSYIDTQNKAVEKSYDGKIAVLQKQISTLQQDLEKATGQKSQATIAPREVAQREIVREQSQDQLVTAAVARVAPSVVSIVISKDVPKLKIVYQNPFGNDPFFKDFGVQVPVYQQDGVERQKVGAGTGFLVSADGYILTNKHVVYDTAAEYTALLASGAQKPAKVVFKDPENDIAVVKIDCQDCVFANLGNSESLKLGQTVMAIGNALGEYNNSVSIGIISGLNRTIQASGGSGTEQLNNVIQTDAAINPGNSGGPMLNLDGDVIGVNVATVAGSSNISFSIPINVVKPVIKTVLGR